MRTVLSVVGGPDLPARRFEPAARATLAERAITLGPGGDGLSWALGGAGAAFVAPAGAGFAQALAARLAAGVGRPVRWFSARMPDPNRVAADLSEGQVRPDGRPGPAPDPVADAWSADLADRCDGKPYFLLSSLADDVLERWGLTPSSTETWTARTFADPRVSAVAADLRACVRAEVTRVDGRTALRARTVDGAASTTFLDAEQLAALREAFPALVPPS